jgi:ABC-type glycerol-3-phosphate transport system substrate-binding protein
MQLKRSTGTFRLRGTKRVRVAAVALAALSLVIAGCGSGDEESDKDSDGKVTITFWAARDFYLPPDKFEGFMEENPDIIVETDVQANDDILQQVSRMKGAGQKMPDIIQDDAFQFPAYVEAGLLLPLDDMRAAWEEEDPDTYSLLPDSAWEQGMVDGKVMAMGPWTTFDQVYVSTPWLEEAGVELPFESLDDVVDAGIAMKEARPDEYPLSVQALAGSGVNSLQMVLFAAGTEFDGVIPDLTSEGGLYAIDWYQRMKSEDLIHPDAIAWGEDEARIAFLSGKAGLMIDSVRAGQDFIDTPDFEWPDMWDLALLPTSRSGDAEDGIWTSAAQPYAMTSDVEHPEEAALVMRYVASTQNLTRAVVELGGLPPRQTEALNSPEVKEAYKYMSDDLRQALLDSEARPSGPESAEVEAILEQMFGEIVSGSDESAESLAEKYQEQLDALK